MGKISATFHTSSGVHPNLQPATGAIEHRWFDGLENASKDTGPNHPPYFDDVLRALERHGVWTGPQDPMSKYLGMYYARMGGRWGMDGKDYGYELTPQERYDEFMSALDQARTEHDAKQDKELQHSSKRQKSVIDMESSEWKVQSAVVFVSFKVYRKLYTINLDTVGCCTPVSVIVRFFYHHACRERQ